MNFIKICGFRYALYASLFLSILLYSTSAPCVCNHPSLDKEWQYAIYGSGIGKTGISMSDIEGDGILEMVMGGSTTTFGSDDFWYIVKKKGSSYMQVWVSELYTVSVNRIVVADSDGNGIGEIFVGFSDGTVKIYDGRTRREKGSFVAGGTVAALVIADVDNDGVSEIIISDGSKIYVYSALTLAKEWESTAYGGGDIAVGNVDKDSAQEIVTTTDEGHGYVLDGISHELKWDYINSFGYLVRLADIDSDQKKEIIGADKWNYITAFDADIKSPKWQIKTDQDIGALLVTDADGDGIPEILYGDGQWGSIHCYDAVSRTEKWSILNPEHGVTDIALGDIDSDGTTEVIWGAGATSSGPDYLYIAGTTTRTIEWQSSHIDGPLSAVDLGDVDNDGNDEIVMVSFKSESEYDSGVIHIFDAKTHALKYQHTLENMDWMGVRTVKVGDVDGDGKNEFVITTADIYDGVIHVYNGATHVLKKKSAGYDGNYFTALAIGDVDSDGKIEIVAGQGREHTGATGVSVIVFDGTTLTEKWKSINLPSSDWREVYDIRIADIDGDGHMEIAVSIAGERVYVFDGVTHQMKWLAAISAYALAVSDIDGDGHNELLVGKDNGMVDVYDGITYALKTSHSVGNSTITGLLVVDTNSNGTREWLVSDLTHFYIYSKNTRKIMTENKGLGNSITYHNHINVRDIDGDGKKEIVLGSNFALYQFDVKTTPTASRCLTANAVAPTQIVLAWDDNSDNETGFKIERKLGNCSSIHVWSQIGTAGKNIETYMDNTGLSAGKTFSYRTKAYNAGGESAYSNCTSAITGFSGTPNSPMNLKAFSVATDRINLSWQDNYSYNENNFRAYNFRVYRKKETGVWMLLYKTTSAKISTYSDTSATGNNDMATYSYYVKACSASGCSPMTTVAVVPYGPTGLQAIPGETSGIKLNWTDMSSNETGFFIYRTEGDCTCTGWSHIDVTGVNATSYNDVSVVKGRTYAYRVMAFAKTFAQPYATGYSLMSNCSKAVAP